MNHENLTALMGNRKARTIAYKTTAAFSPMGFIEIQHHGNDIALIGPNQVWVTTAGWSTQTTIARLHKILGDALPGTGYAVGIRNGQARLLDANRKPIADLYSCGLTVNSNGTVY